MSAAPVTGPSDPDPVGRDGSPTVVLVETSDALPGLLPFQAWDALGTAEVVWVRDRETHPAAPHLYFAGLDLADLPPASLARADLDLNRPGDPSARRLAKALLSRAVADGRVVYLLGPDDEGLKLALAGMAPDHDAELELVFLAQEPAGTALLRLVAVMRRLRDPEAGCPWDLEQDHASLVGHLLEEAYELVDAIEDGDDREVVEELGDLLLQVVFHGQVGQDRGAFTIDDIARGITEKLIRRHPHVFADGDADTPEAVQANWDRLKAAEKARTGPFDGVPVALPGLSLHATLQRKAAKQGLAPPPVAPTPVETVDARLAALRSLSADADADAREQALGELIGAVVALAGELDVDPERAARQAGRRLRARTEAVLALARREEVDLAAAPAEVRAALWARLDEGASC